MNPRSATASQARQALLAAAALGAALLLAPPARAAWGPKPPQPGKVVDGKFTLGRPPSARFGESPDLTCREDELARTLKEQLEEVAKRNKLPLPRPDGRLCAAAEAFLGWDPKEQPRDEVKEFVSRAVGLPTPVSRYHHVAIPTGDVRILSEKLLEPIGNFALNAQAPRYGIAALKAGGYGRGGPTEGSTRIVLLLQDVPYSIDPFPRRLAAGEKAVLSGKILGDYQNPRITLSDVLGRVSTPPQPPGTAFKAEVSCGDKPGRIGIEIAAERGGSPALVARIPVACGTELPASVPVVEPNPWPAEPDKQERRMLTELNAERTAVGLKALVWDDALAGVARGISESIREGVRRGSYDVPGDVVERLKKAGVISPLVLQNPAQARSAEEASEQLLSSPGHRANAMNPDVTNAGVGIAPDTGKDGSRSAFVTQLFVKELPPLDPEAVKKQLREAVERKRRDARQPPVAFDATLDGVAEKYARELAQAGGSLSAERKTELTRPLNKGFKTVQVLAGARADPLDFAEEPEVVSAGKFAGVGVAIGTHPTLGRNAVYAVILVGTKR